MVHSLNSLYDTVASAFNQLTGEFADGQTFGQLTGEFIDGQTIGRLSGEFVDGQTIGHLTDEFVDGQTIGVCLEMKDETGRCWGSRCHSYNRSSYSDF